LLHFRQMNSLMFLLIVWTVMVTAAELPPSQHRFTVIAHRANHTQAHENTRTAIVAAIEAGVDFAEIDVRRTADGQYVLMHDQTVDRMTDGHGRVQNMTLAQIQALHVRDLKRPQISPDRVPTLPEILALIKGRLNIYLDFKDGDRAAVARAIRDAGVTRQILVYDDVEAVTEWRRVAPDLPLIVSPPDTARTPVKLLEFARKHHVEVLDGSWDGYSREMVASAQAAGIQVWPDIQRGREDGEYFAEVMKPGFSGVQTDHPEELIAWLIQHYLR
jgi:glycerophosphoryl diester phosphodiesterase